MQKDEKELIHYGKNEVADCLKTKEVTKLYLQKEAKVREIIDLASKKNVPYVFVDKITLDKMTSRGQHQGVVAVLSPVEYVELNDLIQKNKKVDNPMIIMVDELHDANNLGAILRVMDAFGTNGIIFNKRRNIQLNGSVAKISTGAINHTDITRVTNLKNAIKSLKKNGYWVAYLDMDGETKVQDFKYDMPLVVVIGGEDKGVTANIKKECDFGLSIDMVGTVNSLNVATATSILCYQRLITR